ncbi:MAG: PAS domain-containing protein [Bacteroidia bacterium]|nr:PAS domain-containing protein [Bacteroidia bacterium]
MLESLPVAAMWISHDLQYAQASGLWLKMIGLEPDYLTRHDLVELLPDVVGRWKSQIADACLGQTHKGISPAAEWGVSLAEWMSWQIAPWQSRQGDISGAVILLQPIRVGLSQQLNSSSLADEIHLLDAVFSQFPQGAILMFDRQLRYLYAHGAGLRDIGLVPGDLIGRTLYEVFPQESWRMVEAQYTGCFEGLTTQGEFFYQNRLYSIQAVPLRNRAGEATVGMVISHDITEQRRSENMYRTLAANLPNGSVVMFDHELRYFLAGGLTFSNIQIDLARGELEGKTIYEVFPQEVCDNLLAPLYREALNGKTVSKEINYRSRYYITYATPVRNSMGHIFGGMVYTHEITELKKAQLALMSINEGLEDRIETRTLELRRANQEIKSFAYIVSHDLRVPLLNIKGFTKELDSSLLEITHLVHSLAGHIPEDTYRQLVYLLEEDTRESMRFIQSASGHMSNLIHAVLKLSQIGRRELVFERLDLPHVLAGVIETMQHTIQELNGKVETGPLPDIVADLVSIEQIFFNLIQNALKYHFPGRPPHVRISAWREENATRFEISDNGRGIHQKDFARIFQMFVRVGIQSTQGEGMGLTYVQSLIRRHGGDISCASVLNDGSTFSFTIIHDLDKLSLLE